MPDKDEYYQKSLFGFEAFCIVDVCVQLGVPILVSPGPGGMTRGFRYVLGRGAWASRMCTKNKPTYDMILDI